MLTILEYLLGKKNNAAIPGNDFHDEYCICYAHDKLFVEFMNKYSDNVFQESDHRIRLFILKINEIRQYLKNPTFRAYKVPEEYNSVKEVKIAALEQKISLEKLAQYRIEK